MTASSVRPFLKYTIVFVSGALVAAVLLKSGLFDKPAPPSTSGTWGKFSGNPKTEWLPDGRKMKVLEEFMYTDPANRTWIAPKDWVVDGASIPQAFWSVIGGPLEGPYRNASICHDVQCDRKVRPWADVHRMFYEGCRCGGLSENKAMVMYAAVYLFGPRWEEKTVMQRMQVYGANGKKSFETLPVRTTVLTKMTEQPGEDVRGRVETYINEKNPSLEQIEQLDRAAVGAAPSD